MKVTRIFTYDEGWDKFQPHIDNIPIERPNTPRQRLDLLLGGGLTP
jgi:hypothetical protein